MRYRSDALLDMIDALTIAGQVSSPVAVSESPLFRRKFSSIYDVMLEGEMDVEQLQDLLVACQPGESETMAGYEVYAVDVTLSLAGVMFTPANRSYLNVTANQIGQNYLASVILSGNTAAAGSTLSYTDGTPKTVTADGSGNYSISISYNWSGTITPSLATDAFCPASQTYSNLKAGQIAQNYAHAACPNFNPINKWTSSFDASHGWTVADYVRTLGDVNDGGKAHLVGFGPDGVVHLPGTGTPESVLFSLKRAADNQAPAPKFPCILNGGIKPSYRILMTCVVPSRRIKARWDWQ